MQLIETVEVEDDAERDGMAEMIDSMLPEGVQQLLARQFERLPDNQQRMLEAASVVGRNFSVETAAAPRPLACFDKFVATS